MNFLIFVPHALTSMGYFVRKMGTWWKWLQRWTYAAAVLTLVHWAALHDRDDFAPALVHFGPLIALEATAFSIGISDRGQQEQTQKFGHGALAHQYNWFWCGRRPNV